MVMLRTCVCCGDGWNYWNYGDIEGCCSPCDVGLTAVVMAGSVVVAMIMRGTAVVSMVMTGTTVLMLEAVVVAVVMEGTCSCYGNSRDC